MTGVPAPAVLAPEIAVAEPIIVEFPAFRLDAWLKKVGTADRRLAKAGLPPFVWHQEEFDKIVRKGGIELEDGTIFGGVDVAEPWIRVHLDQLCISAGHFTFVAALVAEEAGYTVHTAPGQSLDGWQRPPLDDIHCDHCNLKRDRKRLYIIRDDRDGSLAQIGHSCIELYTGLKLKGLWALEYGPQFRALGGEGDGGGGGDSRAPLDIVLGLAFSFADEGRSYISVKAAECGVGEATGGLVRSTIFYPPRQPKSRDPRVQAEWRKYLEKVQRGYEFAKDAALIADIKAAAASLKPGTDYADNMHTILAGEYVSQRGIGTLASLVAVYAREKELAVKREQDKKAPLAKGFLAPVKTRLRGLELVLTTVKSFETEWGQSTLLVGRTPDHHLVKWFASGSWSVEPGDTLVIDATVKAHDVWEPRDGEAIDQTVVTRGKLISHAPADAVC